MLANLPRTLKFMQELATQEIIISLDEVTRKPKNYHSTFRNGLKPQLLECLLEDLQEALAPLETDILRVDNGIGIDIPHEEHGGLPITIDTVFKNPFGDKQKAYNVYKQHQLYMEDKKEKELKLIENKKALMIKYENSKIKK